jgi:hypothetical protein
MSPEKAEIPSDNPVNKGRFFFRKHQENATNEDNEMTDYPTEVDAPISKAVSPVRISELFRYAQSIGRLLYNMLIAVLQLHNSARINM